MVTYAADSHTQYGELYYWPAKTHAKGSKLDIFEWETNMYLGQIDQVEHTYTVIGNMNEFQLVIAETTFEGRQELRDSTGILDYGNLIYITLQRAKTAREAIQIMTGLVEKYGYYSSGESFSIADAHEAWIMEMVGKGKGNKGALWVALKIPDGYISGHANMARITTFPLNDSLNCLYAKDVISFARAKKYFNGPDSVFSFADAYMPLDFIGARICDARVWSGIRKVNSEMETYTDYIKGENYNNRMPLWFKPNRKIHIVDVINMMRDHFQGTDLDMTKDIGAGPFGCPVRWRPLFWKYEGETYFNERAISTQQTGFSFISQSRSWLPDPIGGKLWFGVDDTYTSVYTPIYGGTNKVPVAFAEGNGSIMQFSDSAAFWIFNQVSNFAYSRYQTMLPDIQKKQLELENNYINQVDSVENKAKELWFADKTECKTFITDYSCKAGQYTFLEWKNLYTQLFIKYMDGNIKTVSDCDYYPNVEQPGYSKKWYEQLVKSSGEKFKFPGNAEH
jgi:dipeptidase